jgi:hypothetical protein
MKLVLGRRRIRFRFFVFIGLIILAAVYIYDVIQLPPSYAFVSFGELLLEYNTEAVIIRQEAVYSAPAHGKAIYHAFEGESVIPEQRIALLYKEGFDKGIINQLHAVQEKISSYQQENLIEQVLDSDLDKLSRDIRMIASSIQDSVRLNSFQSLGSHETRLRRLLVQRQKVIDKISEPDEYLNRLYEQEGQLLKVIHDWTVEIKAQQAGIISFYLDGLENILAPSSIDRLTPEDFKTVMDYAVPSSTPIIETKAEQPFYKIVDPLAGWFVVFEIPVKDLYFELGRQLDVRFFPDDGAQFSGTVHKIIKGKGKALVALEMNGELEKAVSRRVIALQASESIEGLIVPETALKKRNGYTVVNVPDRDAEMDIEVSVKAVSDGYAVIEPISDNQILKLHDQVRIR